MQSNERQDFSFSKNDRVASDATVRASISRRLVNKCGDKVMNGSKKNNVAQCCCKRKVCHVN